MKKLLSLFAIFVIFLSAPAYATKLSIDQTTTVTIDMSTVHDVVIIASDNEFDQVAAHNMKVALNGKANVEIKTIPWGEIDADVINTIISESPDAVIIVGGNAAVPSDYYDTLTAAGITVIRLAGKDEYATQAAVLSFLKSQHLLSGQTAVKIDGTDTQTIETSLQSDHIIILVHANRKDAEISCNGSIKITKDLTKEDAQSKAKSMLEKLQEMKENTQNEQQKEFLEKVLEKAEEYYGNGQYNIVIVMGRLISQQRHETIEERILERQKQMNDFMKNRAIRYATMLDNMISRAQQMGIDVSAYIEISNQVHVEIQEGDYKDAIQNARRAMFSLGKEMRTKNKDAFRSFWSSFVSTHTKWWITETMTYTLPTATCTCTSSSKQHPTNWIPTTSHRTHTTTESTQTGTATVIGSGTVSATITSITVTTTESSPGASHDHPPTSITSVTTGWKG